MFHSSSWPVTFAIVPRRRRAASRTVANASGRISSSTSLSSSRNSFSTPPRPSVPLSSSSMRERSSGSAVSFFCSLSFAISASSSAVRALTMPRNFSVCARSSSSERFFSSAYCSLISSMSGWMRFTSRSWRVPKMADSTVLIISIL